MNGVEKAADKLLKSLKGAGSTPKKSKLDEKDAKNWNKYFTAIAKLTNKKNANEAAGELINFYKTIVDTNLNKASTELINLGGVIAASKEDDSAVKKAVNDLSGKMDKIDSEAKLHWGEFDKNDDNDVIIPINAVDNIVKGIIVSFEDGKEKNTKEVKFKMGRISTKDILDDDIAVLVKTGNGGLEDRINSLKTFAKGLKGFSDRRIKEIDAMYKELEKQASDKSTNAINKFLLKQKASFGTNVRALVAGVYLDAIFSYSSASKKLLAYLRNHADMYKVTEL